MALLVYDDQISDYFVPASDGTIAGIRVPSGSIPRRTGQLLVSSLLVSMPLALPLCHIHQIASRVKACNVYSCDRDALAH